MLYVQNDLRGSLPGNIINLMSSMQPMCLMNIRKSLENDVNSSKRPALMSRSNKPAAYKDLLFAFESVKSKHSINGEIGLGDADKATDQPSSSDAVLFLDLIFVSTIIGAWHSLGMPSNLLPTRPRIPAKGSRSRTL